jgi:ribosomal protein L37E
MDLPTCQIRIAADGTTTILCRLCGRESTHPGDVAHRYCGACHLFHDAVAEARYLHGQGATHECAEWTGARAVCAVCGRTFEAQLVDRIPLSPEELRRFSDRLFAAAGHGLDPAPAALKAVEACRDENADPPDPPDPPGPRPPRKAL